MESPDCSGDKSSGSGSDEGKGITFETVGHCSGVLAMLDELRKDGGQHCDVTLLTEGKRFPCHKAVLIGGCEYFRAMFGSNLLESQSKEVVLKNIPPDTLECVLQFLYTGRIKIEQNCLDITIIKTILQTADLFNLPDLKVQCERHLVKCITVTNCLELYFFAKLHSLSLLQSTALEYKLEHFVEVCTDEDFNLLDADQLVGYISNDRLNAPNEDPVYAAVRKWFLHDWTERKCHVGKVLTHVRFPLCSPQYFLDTIEHDTILKEAGCEVFIKEYQLYHLVPERRDEMSEIIRAQPRISQTQQRLVLFGGRDKEWKTMKKVWYLDQTKMLWEELCDMPFDNFLFSACCLNNRVYVTGGYRIPHGTSRDLWEYSGYSGRWTEREEMETAREDHGSVPCSGCVYVMGGTSATERVLLSVEKYDPEVNEWSAVTDLLTPVFQPAVAAVMGKIYVIGGTQYSHTHIHKYSTHMAMQVLDTATGQWSRVASSMFRITGGCAAVLGSRIYLSCGYDKLLCSYDAAKAKWEYHSVSPLGHCRGKAVVLNGKVLLLGGKYRTKDSRYDWTANVDVFDPATKSWNSTNLPPCPRPATDFGAVLLNLAV